MKSLANMYDTVNQVKLQITTFSEVAILDLPMGHYNELQIADAMDNICEYFNHSKYIVCLNLDFRLVLIV